MCHGVLFPWFDCKKKKRLCNLLLLEWVEGAERVFENEVDVKLCKCDVALQKWTSTDIRQTLQAKLSILLLETRRTQSQAWCQPKTLSKYDKKHPTSCILCSQSILSEKLHIHPSLMAPTPPNKKGRKAYQELQRNAFWKPLSTEKPPNSTLWNPK